MPVDDADFRAAFDALIGRVSAAAPIIVQKGALATQAAGMKRTRVVSGTLRRSWRTERVGAYAARVGPTMVYARRIELGFRGPDSLGRTYNQAPKPYVRPAYDEVLPTLRAFAKATLTAALRG